MRRENEHLRSMVQSNSGASASASAVTAKTSLTNLKEMVSLFDGKKGSYPCWKKQLITVRQVY